MKPARADISNRRLVWGALFELFLDTELQSADFKRLCRILAMSPYTLEEIEDILFREVYPVCIWNLRCVTGEWAGFDGEWLQAAILKKERSLFKIPRFLQMGHWMVRDPWQKVKNAIQAYEENQRGRT